MGGQIKVSSFWYGYQLSNDTWFINSGWRRGLTDGAGARFLVILPARTAPDVAAVHHTLEGLLALTPVAVTVAAIPTTTTTRTLKLYTNILSWKQLSFVSDITVSFVISKKWHVSCKSNWLVKERNRPVPIRTRKPNSGGCGNKTTISYAKSDPHIRYVHLIVSRKSEFDMCIGQTT